MSSNGCCAKAGRSGARRLDALAREGWTLARQRGSHRQYTHAERDGRVTVPHPRKEIPTGTLRNIYRQAGWPLGGATVAMRYLVIVHHDRTGGPFGVTVPDLPGCFSGGDTLADALENAREAIVLHVEGLLSDHEPVPAPAPTVDADGGIVAVVHVDDGLLSDRTVRLNITLPSRIVGPLDDAARRAETTRSGLLARIALAHLARGAD